MNYQDLKTFCNRLTEEELQQPVRVWGDGFGKREITEIDVLAEDMINPSGDGAEPVSAYANDPDFDVEDEPLVARKGEIILVA